MTRDELEAKWQQEADAMRSRSSLVNGAALCEEFLRDLQSLERDDALTAYTLVEAAARTGYSADRLGRLVRQGTIPNAGRPNAPRILGRDLPRRPGALRDRPAAPQLVGATPGQIARRVVNPEGDAR